MNPELDKRLERAAEATFGFFRRELRRTKIEPCPAYPQGADGGFWHAELEADTTLESDYILFLYFMDPGAHAGKIQKLARYILSRQLPDGSWNIYHEGPGEVSASVKAYFALKLAGATGEEPHMRRAREAILRLGGAERVNSFTKIYLSFLGQYDDRAVPAIPPEVVLLPRLAYINLYEISYWSRVILVPLAILYARKARRAPPAGLTIRELFAGGDPGLVRDSSLLTWRNFFIGIDRLLKIYERLPFKLLRGRALRRAEAWMLERFEDSDGLGAIFPSMVNSVLAMRCLGYEDSHPEVVKGMEKLAELEIEEDGLLRLQPCLSPVWDTVLAMNALREAGFPADAPEMELSARWVLSKEARRAGDWQLRVPGVEASGWYFQFRNDFYPDIDDTAAVLLALDRCDRSRIPGIDDALQRGIEWVLALQSRDGGWAAFDSDITREVLTKVPYADHNAMLDPSCADITGRMLEMLGRFPSLRGNPRYERSIERAIAFLKSRQERDGSWWGRWGVNYIYGTWQALKGLASIGEDVSAPYVRKAVEWLKSCQLADGGWGETCATYDDPTLKGRGPSTASQTAWALMGLIAAGEDGSPEVEKGVAHLLERQGPDGTWPEEQYTGTGFPKVFYLKYHYYRIYFPLFALGLYRNVRRGAPPLRGDAAIALPAERPRRRARALAGLRSLFGLCP